MYFGVGSMKDEPEIVKQLRAAERFGVLQNKVQGAYKEMENPEELFDGEPDGSVGFVEDDDMERKTKDKDTYYEGLRVSEERFRSLVETISDWVWEVDQNGKYTYASPKVKDLLGYEAEEVIGKTPFDFMPEDEAERIGKAFRNIAESKEPFAGLENMNLHKDGRRVVLETSGMPFLDGSGNLLGYRGIDRDITERKKTEETLRESEERYHDLFENVNDMIQAVKPDGSFLYVNRTWKKTLGYNQDEIVDLSVFDIIHPDSKKHCMELFKRIMSREKIERVEASFVTKDGQRIDIEGSINCHFEEGKPVSARGIFRDITERKKVDDALRESEERLRTILEAVKDGITFSDEAGHFEVFNSEMEKLTGYSMKEANASPDFNRLIYPDSEKRRQALDGLNKLSKPGDIYKTETTFHTKKGIDRDMLISTIVVLYKGRKMFLSAYHDITERKKAEAALQDSVERYHGLIEGSHDGYLMTDMDEKIIEYNNVFKKITGYTDEELHKKTHKDITPQEWHSIEVKIIKEQVLKDGYSEVYEKELIGRDGRIIPVEFRRYLLKEKDKPARMWSFVRDITDRKQTEDELFEKINALERYKNITVGRELRIIELKKKVKKLEVRKG